VSAKHRAYTLNTAAKRHWDHEVDVIIIGAGGAGMSAAIVSKNEGLEPLRLEKTDQAGGTSAWSVCMMWFVDSSPMHAAGFNDSTESAGQFFGRRDARRDAGPCTDRGRKRRAGAGAPDNAPPRMRAGVQIRS
jgi:cation diffusion facilitator CzcD-associated flavoprotein CzcO